MRRFLATVLASGLVLAACTIEPTPAEYFDHRDPAEQAREEAADEIQDRLLAAGQALNRGDAAEAYAALSPADDLVLIESGGADTREGADRVAALLERLAVSGRVRVRDARVAVGPRASVAWFTGLLDAASDEPAAQTLRVTGVYVLLEGSWRLVQAHFSTAADSLTQPQSYPAEQPAPEGVG